MPRLKLDVEALTVETFVTVAGNGGRGTVLGAGGVPFGAVRVTPAEDTGCTAPCLSGDSMCEIESCGSTCEAGSCYAACEAHPGTA
jgi:hypothetical protein